MKVHYWVKQGWIHYRRSPSGKHLIIWADRDELRRLRKIAGKKASWFAAKNPELVIPKKRRLHRIGYAGSHRKLVNRSYNRIGKDVL